MPVNPRSHRGAFIFLHFIIDHVTKRVYKIINETHKWKLKMNISSHQKSAKAPVHTAWNQVLRSQMRDIQDQIGPPATIPSRFRWFMIGAGSVSVFYIALYYGYQV